MVLYLTGFGVILVGLILAANFLPWGWYHGEAKMLRDPVGILMASTLWPLFVIWMVMLAVGWVLIEGIRRVVPSSEPDRNRPKTWQERIRRDRGP